MKCLQLENYTLPTASSHHGSDNQLSINLPSAEYSMSASSVSSNFSLVLKIFSLSHRKIDSMLCQQLRYYPSTPH